MPREYISINWVNNRLVISGLSIERLFNELDKIPEKASLSKMEFFAFFKEVYYETRIKKSRAKTKINLMINISLARSIAIPYCKKIADSFREQTLANFTEIVKKRIKNSSST